MSGDESSSAEVESTPQDVVFGLVLILSGGAFMYHNLSRLKLPYTVIMFLYGLLMGGIGAYMGESKYADIFNGLNKVPPELVFHIFLPILIFEGSYGMKTHAFWSIFSFVLLLAGPGLLINMAFVGIALKVMYPLWSWYLAGLLGSILSATDPVAVVALLKDLGVDKRITAMVDGEAIMNDGTAIIMYTLLVPAAKYGYIVDPWYMVAYQCVQLTIGAVAFGLFCGVVTKYVLQKSYGNELVQTCITVSFAYIAFFVADVWLKTSGVLTLCFMGVYLATYLPTLFPGKEGSTMNVTWHFLVHIANTALFALVGVVIAMDVVPFLEVTHLFKILGLYVVATVARFAMIMILKPAFSFNKNYVVGLREAALLVHGGLRGGVATMLALMVYHVDGIALEDRAEVLILTSGIVILTLAVNATTAQTVVGMLGHRSKDQNRLVQMDIGMRKLRKIAVKAVRETKLHPFFTGANWDRVEQLVTEQLHNPYEGTPAVAETEDRMFNVLLMRAFKTKVWSLRDSESISENAVRILATAASQCIAKGRLITTADLIPLMTYPPLLSSLYKSYFPRGNAATGDAIDNGADAQNLSMIGKAVLNWRLSVDRDFFAILIAYNEALELVEQLYDEYALQKEHLRVAERWLESEMADINKQIKVYGKDRPNTMCAFMTKSAAELVVKDLIDGADKLHEELGFALPATEALVHSCNELKFAVHGWPTQITPVDQRAIMAKTSIIANYPADKLHNMQQNHKVVFKRGDEINLGNRAGVVIDGVLSAFGALERHRGPGDCFNVAASVCRTIGPEYVVASKTATIVVVPYEVLRDGFSDSFELFKAIAGKEVADEVLSLLAKEALVSTRNVPLEDVADALESTGKLLIADADGYCVDGRGDAMDGSASNAPPTLFVNHADATAFADAVRFATTESDVTNGTKAKESPAAVVETPLPASLSPSTLLAAITSPTQHQLYFIVGASHNNKANAGRITTAVGPAIVPVTVASRCAWQKGSVLYTADLTAGAHHKTTAPISSTLTVENASVTNLPIIGEGVAAEIDADSVPVGIGELTRGGVDDDGAANGLEMSPSRYFSGDLQIAVSSGQFEAGNGPSMTPVKSTVAYHLSSAPIPHEDLHIVLSMAAEQLADKYHPDRCLTPIPYLNKLQLRFLVALEQLMCAVARLADNSQSTEVRVDVAAITEDTLDFLQQFCLESFSAEHMLLKLLVQSSASISAADPATTTTTKQAAATPTATRDDLPALIAAHETQHNRFVEQVALWRERTAHNDMCHDSVITGMAAFAGSHFAEDATLCAAASPFMPTSMAAIATRADFLALHVDDRDDEDVDVTRRALLPPADSRGLVR